MGSGYEPDGRTVSEGCVQGTKMIHRIFTALFILCFWIVESHAQGSKKPNVLFIAIDDLNDWVGFMDGHPQAVTPHMDSLAKRGRNFLNAHCAVPVCSASRASVMSGVAATTHGSYELGSRYEQLPALKDVPTIQRYFKDHGYTTLSGGKMLHHNFNGRLAGDIDQSLGRSRSPRPKKPLSRPANWSGAWDWGAYPAHDAEMADIQLAHNAAKTLKEDFDKPFFMSVGFFRPHVPLFVPPKWFELYGADKITLPKNPKSDLDDLPKNFLSINDYAACHHFSMGWCNGVIINTQKVFWEIIEITFWIFGQRNLICAI